MNHYNHHHHHHHPISGVAEAEHRHLQKIVHTLGGLFIWEFFTTLWFEWSFIRGKRSYRWSIWVYVAMRLVTLLNVGANLIESDLRKSIPCSVWVFFENITVYLTFILGSLLLILKIAAIWNKNKLILGVCIGAWSTNIAFMIRSIVTSNARWDSTLGVCVLLSGQSTRDSILATFCSESFLLLVMLAGLLHQRDHYLGRLLFNQGIIWLLVAIFAQVPLIVLLSLNDKDRGDLIFHSSALLSMAICVTRLYRGLSMVNDHPRVSTPRSPNIPTIGHLVLPKSYASYESYHSTNQGGIQTQTITILCLPGLDQANANGGTSPDPKSTAMAGFHAV